MPRRKASETNDPAPFVKWAGGKGQLLDRFEELLPRLAPGQGYHEPFVGSGALFFRLANTHRLTGRIVLSDANEDLMGAWQAVRDEPNELAHRVARLARTHSTEQYYRERDNYNTLILPPLERAALTIYLNRTGFNGLYRVNADGKFNVPCGRPSGRPFFPSGEQLVACARVLQKAELLCAPFESVLLRARPGDFVYFDPPYVPVSRTAFFTDYSKGGFGAQDQERLSDVFRELEKRGCRVMLSNSGSRVVRKLYAGYDVVTIQARRAINSKATARGPVTEVVIRSYE